MTKKEVQYETYSGDFYEKVYEKTDIYCPSCGVQNVWIEDGDGDYYQGLNHVCADCGASYYSTGLSRDEEAFQQLKGE